MKDLLAWLKRHWWILAVCATAVAYIATTNYKIEETYVLSKSNAVKIEQVDTKVDLVEAASVGRAKDLQIDQAKIETDLAHIKTSLLRIEEKLDR